MRRSAAVVLAFFYCSLLISGAAAADVQVAVNLPQFYSSHGGMLFRDARAVLSNSAVETRLRSGDIHLASWIPQPTRHTRDESPDAAWTAGLSAWRRADYGAAAGHFERVAIGERASSWMIAAGAFWAARSHLFARRPDQVSSWLGLAADNFDTFYPKFGGLG